MLFNVRSKTAIFWHLWTQVFFTILYAFGSDLLCLIGKLATLAHRRS